MTHSFQPVNQPAAENSDTPEEIAEAVHALRHLFRTRHFHALGDGPLQLAPMEARALNFIVKRPDTTQTALIAHWARDKGQIARLILGLKERGLIETTTDDSDRRVQRLRLTVAGTKAHRGMQKHRARIAQQAVAGLPEDDREKLLELLGRLKANLEALP